MFKNILKIFLRKRNRSFNDKLDITIEEIKKYEREGAIIIDVRSKQEYEECHLEGSINIPEYDIKKKAEKILKQKDNKIVLYCSTGQRSKRVQQQLRKIGYTNIYNVYGGIEL